MSADLSLIGTDLAVGDHERIVCPVCEGGGSGEQSMSITRTHDGVLFKCFRAKCGVQGVVAGSSGNLVRTRSLKKEPAVFSGSLHPLSPGWKAWLYENLGLTDHTLRKAGVQLTDTGRVAYPIYGPRAEKRGHVTRSYTGQEPKALTYLDKSANSKLSWYRPSGSRQPEVTVVEDIPSALRASKYVDSIALNGASLSLEEVSEIANYYRLVRWALDADATVSALDLHKEHGLHFERSRVLILSQDMKNTPEAELKEILK